MSDPMKLSYEQWITALCLWREGRGQTLGALRGIYYVIANRVADHRYPNDPISVILQPKQFSSFNANDPNSTKYPNPSNAPDWAAFQSCLTIVDQPGGDPTSGATSYESCDYAKIPRPKWADPAKITAEIGPFRFYRLP